MRRIHFSRTSSRLAALAILGAVLGVIFLVFVLPFLAALEESRAEAAQLQTMLDRYQRLAAGLPEKQAQLEALQADGVLRHGFLEERTESLAAAMLQEQVKTVAVAEGAHITSVQVLPEREEGKARRVSLRVRMTADIGQLQRLLYHFEAGRWALFIDSLDVRAVSGMSGGGQNESGILDISFDLYGLMWREP